MRWWPLTLLLPLLWGLAEAQPQLLAEDPAGDVEAEAYGAGAPVPAEAVDLRALYLEERPEDFVLQVEMEGADEGGLLDQGLLEVVFRHGGHGFLVRFDRGENATLHALEMQGPRLLAHLGHEAEGATVSATMPRDLLRDEQGAPPLQGARLEAFHVTSTARLQADGPDPEQGFFCCTEALRVRDAMPDDEAAYEVRSGGRTQEGDLRVWAEAPFVAVNGGGALRFDLHVRNTGEEGLPVQLVLKDVPAHWEVEADPPEEVAAGAETTFPVVVRTPFGHRHGGTTEFWAGLEATGGRSPGDHRAAAMLGVHVLAVAHPSGHHPELHLHTRAEGGQWDPLLEAAGYAPGALHLSTLDPEGGPPVDSTHSSFLGDESRWDACLGLALPLDFDLEQQGGFAAAFSADRPFREVSLSGRLLHFGPGGADDPCDAEVLRTGRAETVLADLPPTDPQELDGTTGFSTSVLPREEADLLAHEPGSVLLLELVLRYDVPDSQAPGTLMLEPGGRLHLPLVDVVPEVDPLAPEPTTTAPEAPETATPQEVGRRSPAPLLLVLPLVLWAAGRIRR